MGKNTINLLIIGDIVSKIGRAAIDQVLPKIKEEYSVDFVIANGENLSHGSGISLATIDQMVASGVNFFTSGDHVFNNKSSLDKLFGDEYKIIRPANYPESVPGDGFKIVNFGDYKILIINLIGRVFMKGHFDCPFKKFDEIYNKNKKDIDLVIVDFHAEATSEKVSLFHYIKDRINIFYGTHTHVPTADFDVINNRFYVTDVGMTGDKNSSLGVDFKNVIKTFLMQIPHKHEFNESGEFTFNSFLIKYDFKSKKVVNFERIHKIGKV